MKIKSFKELWPEDIDKKVNEWLKDNEGKIQVLQLAQSSAGSNGGCFFFVTISYIETQTK